ncbi:hypothetical protein [Mesorhizobium marinum]|uniref:hypothetical protein n=1 Tax=Mesorhizobium marinum TaxID=3228790 RepID=UPI0034664D2B
MDVVARWLGILATIAWLGLAALTAAMGVFMSDALGLHLAVASIVAAAGVLSWARFRAIDRVQSVIGSHRAMRVLLQIEIVTTGFVLLIAIMLLTAAIFRTAVERLPLFG